MTIRSKTMERGNPHESEWPSDFGTAEKGGLYYWCKESKTFKEGYPPPPIPKLGKSAYVIQDTCDPKDYAALGARIDSKSKAKRIMKEKGYEVRDSTAPVAHGPKFKDATDDDFARDVAIAREQIRAGTAPLNEYEREKCRRIDEQLKKGV